MENNKLLYIIYFDLCENSYSASKVRPKKILDAFSKYDVDIVVLDGNPKKILQRKTSINKTKKIIKNKKINLCYIELPSGPLLNIFDYMFIKYLGKNNIKISLFYRDLYWKYPEIFLNKKNIIELIKGYIIKKLQIRDLKLYKKHAKIIYLPSSIIGSILNLKRYELLPPGCDTPTHLRQDTAKNKVNLTGVYVGGASERYGTFLLLDSFMKINKSKFCKLIFVCPSEQWHSLPFSYQCYKNASWLEVKHLNSDELPLIYSEADYAIIPLLKNVYNDFAVPVKLFEYISYNKPILATNCFEVANYIRTYGIGVIVEANVSSLVFGVHSITSSVVDFATYKKNLSVAYKENTWDMRVEKVIYDLMGDE